MELRNTVSSIFFVPTLRIDRDKLKENNFINAYFKDKGLDVQYEDCAYLLFKPQDLANFNNFLDEERDRTPTIVDDYDYDGGYVVLVYTLDPKYKQDFDLIRQGRYSKTSKEFQNIFPKLAEIILDGKRHKLDSLQHRIFTKNPDLKSHWEDKIDVELKGDMELWEGFDEENETLDINKIREVL